MTAEPDDTVLAAGGVVWRTGPRGDLEVCLVHRPRYDDWSLPKGKLHAGEHPLAGAVREVTEETGVVALPQVRLPTVGYVGPTGAPKRVDYWLMRAVDAPDFEANREVDDVRWLPPAEAAGTLSYGHDAEVVAAAAALPAVGGVVVLLRHAYAGERDEWNGPDDARPLDERGRRQAEALADLLHVFAPGLARRSLRSASPDRCRQTLEPLAARLRLPIEPEPAFDEGADPAAAADLLVALGRSSAVTIVSSQGKLLPKVVGLLTGRAPDGYATRKGDAWLIAFPASSASPDKPRLAGLDRINLQD